MTNTIQFAPRLFPSKVLNTPLMRPVLCRIFNYDAPVYDLDAYERVSCGLGIRIWAMIQREMNHQKVMHVVPSNHA